MGPTTWTWVCHVLLFKSVEPKTAGTYTRMEQVSKLNNLWKTTKLLNKKTTAAKYRGYTTELQWPKTGQNKCCGKQTGHANMEKGPQAHYRQITALFMSFSTPSLILLSCDTKIVTCITNNWDTKKDIWIVQDIIQSWIWYSCSCYSYEDQLASYNLMACE